MSRYSRDRSKQSGKTTFIITILASILIGAGSALYILQYLKSHKPLDTVGIERSIYDESTDLENIGKVHQVEDSKTVKPFSEESLVSAENVSPPLANKNDLPDLLSSDKAFRRALIALSPDLRAWLNSNLLIRKFVVIANDFSQGIRIFKHISFLRLDEPFSVEQGENGLQIAPKSYRRYDSLAQAINAIDARALMMVYQRFRPLMVQVFNEFGYPKDITLESIVNKAASEIIASPVIDGQIFVVRPSLFYKFADPKLEALNPVQKQMLRMGSENARIIQNKCREIMVELGKSGIS